MTDVLNRNKINLKKFIKFTLAWCLDKIMSYCNSVMYHVRHNAEKENAKVRTANE